MADHDQINLRKKGPSRAIPRIEWHGWTTATEFGWLEQKVSTATYVQIGDIKEGSRSYPTDEKAIAALLRAVDKKLAEGFEYEDEPPPPPPPKPSKPWAKAVPTPTWLAKVPKPQVAAIRRSIADAKLAHRAADIESLLLPAISLAVKTIKPGALAKLTTVTTRFGGDPDVPAAFAWPSVGDVPLAFMAQYRLEELTKYDLLGKLPKRGVLSTFVHLDPMQDGYGDHARVYFFPDVKSLVRTPSPHAADVDNRPSKIALATPSVKLTLPPPDHATAGSLRLNDDERSAYHDGVWLASCENPRGARAHQLLGWPDMMNGYAYTRGMELFAQIDSDDRFGFECGDVECLRLHITAKKLAAGDFKTVRCTMSAE